MTLPIVKNLEISHCIASLEELKDFLKMTIGEAQAPSAVTEAFQVAPDATKPPSVI